MSRGWLPVSGAWRVSAVGLCLALLASCSAHGWRVPGRAQAAATNPVFVPGQNPEHVWERTVDVLHSYYFEIERENKLDGVIQTKPKVSPSFLEPWHRETVGHRDRTESTLQSIRRHAFVSITPVDGGFLVGVEAYKELEDLPGLAANSAGNATFQENQPLQRDLNLVVGQTAPSGWIPRGRDPLLEQKLLGSVQAAFGK